jgi:manganese/zinc/iron transport system ATP- binding protein
MSGFPSSIADISAMASPPAATSTMPAVVVEDVTVAYGETPVVWDVNLTIPVGSLTAIIGPNGAGKSTLLKAMLGLVPVVAGHTRFLGQAYSARSQTVSYVPQRSSVDWDFPTNALDVVMMGAYGRLGWFRRPGRAERLLALDCLEQLGMADFAQRQISQLSGGQQQRVFLARALAQQAKIYLMDEPFAGVDATTERAIVGLLRDLQARGKTVICVHHDLDTAPEYFDWLVLLNRRLIASGPMATTFTAENLRATYGGRLALLDERVEASRPGAGQPESEGTVADAASAD